MRVFRIVFLGIAFFLDCHISFAQICSKEQLPQNLQQGLVAYYPFCGDLNDASGNNLNIQNNGAVLANDFAGNSNRAYYFNGQNAEMSIPAGVGISALVDNFTISFWIKNDKPVGHSGMHILHRGNNQFTIGVNSDNTLAFTRQGNSVLLVSSASLTNQWTLVTYTKEGTTNKLFYNGELDVTVESAVTLQYFGDPMIIGRASPGGNGGSYRFEGFLSDLLIYNRVLSDAEIIGMFESNLPCTSNGLNDLIGDTTVSYNSIPELSVAPIYSQYLWNTGDTSASILVNKSGLYSVSIRTKEGCTLNDSTFLVLNYFEIQATDTLLCGPSAIRLSVPMDKGSFKYVGSYGESDYFMDTVSRSWPMARAAAQAQGMDLWVIENQAENDSVYNLLPYAENGLVNYWIGLYQDRNSPSYNEPLGGWKWVDGSVLLFSNWLGGEPNNTSGFAPYWEDYGIMWTVPFHGKWNDYYSETQDPAILSSFKTLAIAEKPRTKYLWSTGDTTSSIHVTPTADTDYLLTINENGLTLSDTIAIKVVDPLIFNPFADTISVCSDSILLDVGNSYSSILWNTGDTVSSIVSKQSGQYIVSVTNANGCNASDTLFLSLVQAKISSTDTAICKGDSLTITSNLLPAFTSVESFPNSLQTGILGLYPFNGNANNQFGKSLNGNVSGATLTTDRFGLPNSAYHFNGNSYIDLGSIPEYSIGNGSLTTSSWFKSDFSHVGNIIRYDNGNTSGGWGILSINSNPNYLTLWGMSFGFGRGQVPVLLTTVSNNEWHHVVHVIDAANSKTKLYIDGNLVDTYQGYNENVIGFENTKLYIGSLDGGVENWNGDIDDVVIYNRALSDSEVLDLYKFTPPSFQKVIWSTGDTTSRITVRPNETTTYTLTVTDGVTTCTDQMTVTVNQVDNSVTSLDTTSICIGESCRLQAGEGIAYVWLKNNVVINDVTSRIFAANTAGSYRVIVTNASGCSDTSAAINITERALPLSGIISSQHPSVCSGANSTQLTLSGELGSIRWQSSADSLLFSDIPSETGNVYTATNLTSTSYYRVIVTNSCGSDTSALQTVVVNPTPVVSFTVNNATQPLSGNLFVFTNTTSVTAGDTYLWDMGNGFYSASKHVTFIYPDTGRYTVSLSVISALGCESSAQQDVMVVDLPESGQITGSASVCGPVNSNTLSVTGSSGTLQWQQSANNISFSNINNATLSSYTAINLTATTYFRVIASKNGLFDTSAVATITVNPKPTVSFTVNNATQVLTGNSFVFTNTSTGGNTYLWRFGNGVTATTQNATYSYAAAGSYVVRLVVISAAGCRDSTSTTVTVTAPPPPPVAAGNLYAAGTTCAQFNVGSANALTQLCYTVSKGKVSVVTPSSFIYYVKVVAPSASFTVNISQTVSRTGFRLFTVNTGGSVVNGDNCVRVTSVSSPSTGQARASITRATVGRTYIIGVQYDTRALVGYTTNGTLTANYTFVSRIGNTTVSNSTSTVTLYPNNCVGVAGGQLARMPELGGLPGASAGVDKTGSEAILQIRVYPNPSNSRFNVLIEGSDRQTKGVLRVINAQGQVVEEIKDVKPGMELQLGVKYTSGTYTAVFIQGNQETRQRMVRY
jgi:PKD repeat protein